MYFQLIQEQQAVLNGLLALCGIAVILLTFIYGLVISNRIAGPIYRLTQYLSEYGVSTNKERLTFRENDYFPEIASSVNSFISSNVKN